MMLQLCTRGANQEYQSPGQQCSRQILAMLEYCKESQPQHSTGLGGLCVPWSKSGIFAVQGSGGEGLWNVMSESMFGDAGAARNSRRRSTARTGGAKSPATTPGQSAGELPQHLNCFSCALQCASLASGVQYQRTDLFCCICLTFSERTAGFCTGWPAAA